MLKWSVFVLLISFIECKQECYSCSGVPTNTRCNHTTQCNDDEVCFMHNFVTELSGIEGFDYGCSSPLACSNTIFGRRSLGHHVKCALCCNTRLCNTNLKCPSSGQVPLALPRECADLKLSASGVHTIYPYGRVQQPVSVFCYVDSSLHSWTVIQRRIDGSVSFLRDWQAYKTGFGQKNKEYWLGNDNIHELTANGNHALKILMTDFSGVTKFAEYLSFHVSSEANSYQLMISKYDGTAGDSLSQQTGYKFSTFDRDNDISTYNCATVYKGAWWYSDCHFSNLNGIYYHGHHNEFATGIDWISWHGYYYSMKTTIMMIRKY